ncbi:MAG TPA: exodeoxyribonuclease VII large subunit [Bacteroidota bacterium]|nr:exodeoxyribonuclease VII large subunit [Bacteroidota bacterium]
MNLNLFEKEEKIYTISEITVQIKKLLESNFSQITIQGEISNFKKQSSGHIYFTLKDENAQINAIIWRSTAQNLKINLIDGMKVIARGYINVYEPSGRYQIIINLIQEIGLGELQIAFEKLKQKLLKEGLFDESHKKEIPRFPKSIGIVTSLSGAAIRDIISVISRRYPIVELIVYPVAVQGSEAPSEIVEGINAFNEYKKVDLIIIGRGGGSLEDLWAFNDEAVARAIYNSKIPIISAVGHHIDFTISDFVSDLRAPTPSVAGEFAVPDKREIIENIISYINSLYYYIDQRIQQHRKHILSIVKSYALNKPIDMLRRYQQKIDENLNIIETNIKHKIDLNFKLVDSYKKRLLSVNPNSILQRGYCIVEKKEKIISKGTELEINDSIKIVFQDSKREAIITK